MEVITILAMGFVCMACFLTGAKVGQAVAKGEKVETPNLNPMQAIKEHKERKEAQKEQELLDAVLENLDNYNGSAQGQKDLPRG